MFTIGASKNNHLYGYFLFMADIPRRRFELLTFYSVAFHLRIQVPAIDTMCQGEKPREAVGFAGFDHFVSNEEKTMSGTFIEI